MTTEEFAGFLKSTLNTTKANDLFLKDLHSSTAASFLKKSLDSIRESNTELALKMVSAVLELSGLEDNSQLLTRRAQCHVLLRNYQEAENDYEEAILHCNRSSNSGFSHFLFLEYAEFVYTRNRNGSSEFALQRALRLPEIKESIAFNNFEFQANYLLARLTLEDGDIDQSKHLLELAQMNLDDLHELGEYPKTHSIEAYEQLKKFSSLRKDILVAETF
ncbi:hypothetical protein [Dyadobacter sp. CY312]|uniref:hypothetical protein n=1 Tax=Dyadobacter sp. CY312 TaxID=2907303 RepID=UPI001F46ACDD|nr:hypothetical protein [Dyadobacter sp. CY312]MCE7043955.1 hypothetical protein [Dyadobacter sp. CY312]